MDAYGAIADNGNAVTVAREADDVVVLGAYNERSGATINVRLPVAEMARLIALLDLPAMAAGPVADRPVRRPGLLPAFARGLFHAESPSPLALR